MMRWCGISWNSTPRAKSKTCVQRSPTFSAPRLLALVSLGAAGLLGSACEPAANEGRLPPETAPPFSVVQVHPKAGSTEVSRNGDVVLEFSDFPDPESLDFPSLSLGPRGDPARIAIEVSLVDRKVRLRPVVPLVAKTEIVLALGRGLKSLAGQPLTGGLELVFRTSETIAPTTLPPAPPTLRQVLGAGAGLAGRCDQAGCHSRRAGAAGGRQEPAAGLDFSLESDALRQQLLSGRRGGTEGLLWVEPGRPERSYVLRKLLAAQPGAFTRITGSPMPLTGAPLTQDALRTIETWIRSGAL